jgi:hypothetical protein
VPNSHAVVRDGLLESTVDEAFEEDVAVPLAARRAHRRGAHEVTAPADYCTHST